MSPAVRFGTSAVTPARGRQHGAGERSGNASGGARSDLLACVDTRTFERAVDARTCEPFTEPRE
jgi:hypothetical protein